MEEHGYYLWLPDERSHWSFITSHDVPRLLLLLPTEVYIVSV